MGVRPLVLLEPFRNSPKETYILKDSQKSQNSKKLKLKWSQINCAFQLAEQIDLCDGNVRGIPVYADYAQASFIPTVKHDGKDKISSTGHDSDTNPKNDFVSNVVNGTNFNTTKITLDLTQIKQHLSSKKR